MKLILTIAYLIILGIQFIAIELLCHQIDHKPARLICMGIFIIFFTLAWLYIAIRILKARPRRNYRDHEFSIKPARGNRYIHD